MLGTAKSEIRVCAYAWRWYENEPDISIQKFNVELLRQAQGGRSVKILCDTEKMADGLRSKGFNARSVVRTRMLHTKAVCIDRRSLVIGSHNLTKRANTDNYEMSVVTQENWVIEQFIDYYDRIWESRA